ncbi:MAG: LptF/LptG family permease [Alphaproteobacteria bacterium]|nr:MAG: LptF/LptG family permease [Alphaproteobacteria bacterium]
MPEPTPALLPAGRLLRRYFLPSRTMLRYLARLFAARVLFVLLLILAVLQMLDLLSRSAEILAVPGNGGHELLRYVGYRLPDFFTRFAPFCVLIAAIVAFAELNQHSEIIVLKAGGLSPHRILLPFTLTALAMALLHFWVSEEVTVPGRAALAYWQEAGYARDLPPRPETVRDLRLVDGRDLVLIARAKRSGSRVVLDGITIYERGEDGMLAAITRASFAWYEKGRWRLFEVRRFVTASLALEYADEQPWRFSATPERLFALSLVADETPLATLARAIARREAAGEPVSDLKAAFYHRFSLSLSFLLMPLLAAVAGFGVHRRGQLVARMAIGAALGFSYFVIDNFMLAMGEFGVVPAWFAAFSPLVLFLAVGLAVLFFTEE